MALALRQRLGDRIRGWAMRRSGQAGNPVALGARRLYILPTRQGLMLALVVLAMLLGAMNYDNSMGFALTFLLASLGLVAMTHCHRNLLGLELRSAPNASVFAGGEAQFRFELRNATPVPRFDIRLRSPDGTATQTDVPAGERTQVQLRVPAEKRGVMRLERVVIETQHPLQLFRSWSWLAVPARVLVYPRPVTADFPVPTPTRTTGDASARYEGDDDFRGLREFQPGDSRRRIAWKTYARGGPPQVKLFGSGGYQALWLDWHATDGDTEHRLSVLCGWALEAQRRRLRFGLRLPDREIAPGQGEAHLTEVLEVLATWGGGHA